MIEEWQKDGSSPGPSFSSRIGDIRQAVMEPSTNPAGRLHEILSDAKRMSGSALAIWKEVFGIEISSDEARNPLDAELEVQIEVISRVLQLQKLIEDTEESLHRIESLSEKYFRPFVRIHPLIKQSLGHMNTDLTSTLAQITEGDMTILEFCSEKLNERHAEPVVNDEELQEILQEVNSLFDEVRDAAIDPELKSFVLDGLEAIRRGINEYRIRGPERLKEALGEVIGSLAVNRDIVKAGRNDNNETVGRFEKLCYRFAAVVSFASDAVGLLNAVSVGLLPGA